MEENRCPTCGEGELRREARPHSELVGRHKTTGQRAQVEACSQCDEELMTSLELRRLELQAVVIAFTDAPHEQIEGAELHDARRILGLTQAQLAEALGYNSGKSIISRWENNHERVPQAVIMAITNMARAELQPDLGGYLESQSA